MKKNSCLLAILSFTSSVLSTEIGDQIPSPDQLHALGKNQKNSSSSSAIESQIDQIDEREKTLKFPLKNTKIALIVAPPVESAGPEALCQLAHKLNTLGIKAYMLWYPQTPAQGKELKTPLLLRVGTAEPPRFLYNPPKDWTPESYKTKYEVSILRETIILNEEVTVVVPEVWPNFADEFFKGTNRLVWWLSTENFELSDGSQQFRELAAKGQLKNLNVIHACQSKAVRKYVENLGCKTYGLYDYIHPVFLENNGKAHPKTEKKIDCLFPKKGRGVS